MKTVEATQSFTLFTVCTVSTVGLFLLSEYMEVQIHSAGGTKVDFLEFYFHPVSSVPLPHNRAPLLGRIFLDPLYPLVLVS